MRNIVCGGYFCLGIGGEKQKTSAIFWGKDESTGNCLEP